MGRPPNLMGRSSHCSRCLSLAHSLPRCSGRIRCTTCFRLGHVASFCNFPPRFPGLSKNPSFHRQIDIHSWDAAVVSGWFRHVHPMTDGPPPLWPHLSAPDSFSGDVPLAPFGLVPSSTAARKEHPLSAAPVADDRPPVSTCHFSHNIPSAIPVPCSTAFPHPPHPPPPLAFAGSGDSEAPRNPPATVTSPAVSCFQPSESTMPLRFVDPTPFMSRGFNRMMIEGRRPVSRAILGRQPRLKSDLAIVTIDPLPNH